MITGPSGPGRTNLAAFVASAKANFTDWTMVGTISTPGPHEAGYSSLLRNDRHGSGDSNGYLVLVETTAANADKGTYEPGSQYGLWLATFSL